MELLPFFEEMAEQIIKILVSDESCGPSLKTDVLLFHFGPPWARPQHFCCLTSSGGNIERSEVLLHTGWSLPFVRFLLFGGPLLTPGDSLYIIFSCIL